MTYDRQLLLEPSIGNTVVDDWKKEGKKVIGTICCHVPEELIYAAGLLPYRIRATGCQDDSRGEEWMSSWACSYCRSCLQFLLDGRYEFLDGIICSDGCLMAGRIFDNWIYAGGKDESYMMAQIGAPRVRSQQSFDFYVQQLTALKKKLECFTGKSITDDAIKDAVAVYNKTRFLIRKLYELRKAEYPQITGEECLKLTLAAMSLPKPLYNDLLEEKIKEIQQRPPLRDFRARLMIIGSALDDPAYLKVIEDAGGLIVTDLNCFGSRYLWSSVTVETPVLESLAKAYLENIVCPRMVDMHTDILQLIVDMAREYRVDGIIFTKMQNCELWGCEGLYFYQKLQEAGYPVLNLEREEIMTSTGQLSIRAEAFVEMLEEE